MIPNLTYIMKCISDLYESKNETYPTHSDNKSLIYLRDELNKAFPDFECKEVIYTDNFDKNFFGIFVCPVMESLTLTDKLMAGLSSCGTTEFEPFKANAYTLEIDGKLIRNFNLTYSQIIALIFQEICAMNSSDPYVRLRNAIDNYICLNNAHINTETIKSWNEIFNMVAKITLHNITSLFTRFEFLPFDNMSDVVRDELYNEFSEAWKILSSSGKMETVNTNTVLLSWYFQHYEDFDNSRDVEFLFRSAMKFESSATIKKLIKISLLSLTQYFVNGERRYFNDVINESSRKKGLIYQMKRNGLKSIEEDLFEYNMRLRNVETQDDAILLMRQINSRMSILEEYLEEEDMDEKDRARWETCYKKYLELREALSKKTVYNKKMYGLFVDYNALQQMNDNGNFMNTYY